MSWRGSLTWRLISRLVTVAILLLAATAIVITTWVDPPQPVDIWYASIRSLMLDSLARGPDGALYIAPTPTLAAYIAARPSLRIGAFETATGRVLRGSSPGLVRGGSDGRISVQLEAGPARVRDGVVIPVDTPFGGVTLVTFGGEALGDDRARFGWGIFVDIGQYAAPALAAVALAVWAVVRVSLAPLRAAGRQAERLDFRAMSARLPDDGRVPSELRPLVGAVNRALDRLQEDFLRQQRFTANAAHEMRTPLGILRARIDTLDGVPAQGELRRDAQRITALVDQTLAIARLEQNGARFDTIDLIAAVGDLVADYAPLAIDGAVGLEFEPPACAGDRLRLACRLQNLAVGRYEPWPNHRGTDHPQSVHRRHLSCRPATLAPTLASRGTSLASFWRPTGR